jgi:demethylmenaquinone methyltransferase/2-methoxy-6-polyprenyl-1,4-benzoquinol methylase
MSADAILREQLDYYRARATEYDEWWLRLGRYDRGAENNAQWFAEAAEVSAALAAFQPAGRVLEFACGTGIWTEQLARTATHVTAVDGSAEMLAVNAARVQAPHVQYVQSDLFQWSAPEEYDAIFFGFWLSHVPPERFDEFWRLVRSSLAPGGRVFFVDSRRDATSTAQDHQLPARDETVQRRRLNDGREFQVYKIFYEPGALAKRLEALGWTFALRETKHYFLFGSGCIQA